MQREVAREGDVIAGRYRLGERLGHGAMGEVFASTRGEEDVAIKLLRGVHESDIGLLRRFDREMVILGQLSHPRVVPVLDAGRDARGVPFLVMPRLRGHSLDIASYRTERPTVMDAVELVLQVARGLAAAHAQGIVHGDVKPANVFLDVARGPVLLDFGASKILGLERITRTGEIAGTPAYLAPELVTGRAPLSARADVFSLGVLAYALLTGDVPHLGTKLLDVIERALHGERAPLVIAHPASAAIATWVERCLAADVDARPVDADAAARTLEAALTA